MLTINRVLCLLSLLAAPLAFASNRVVHVSQIQTALIENQTGDDVELFQAPDGGTATLKLAANDTAALLFKVETLEGSRGERYNHVFEVDMSGHPVSELDLPKFITCPVSDAILQVRYATDDHPRQLNVNVTKTWALTAAPGKTHLIQITKGPKPLPGVPFAKFEPLRK